MGVKEKFTEEEWRALLKAPMLVSYAVAGAGVIAVLGIATLMLRGASWFVVGAGEPPSEPEAVPVHRAVVAGPGRPAGT